MPEVGVGSVRTVRLGPLPLLNHFLDRLDLPARLSRFVPTTDQRCRLPYATSLGVLLRSLLVEREPIYRQQETVQGFAPAAFGLDPGAVEHLHDDTIGRALDRLFVADRGGLLTTAVVAAGQRFGLRLGELHQDTTSIRFAGQYPAARGRSIRGRRAPWITYGHSKDHRPDLKQLLGVLVTSADGGIPVQFRTSDGNTSDSRTPISLRSGPRRARSCRRPSLTSCTRSTRSTEDRRQPQPSSTAPTVVRTLGRRRCG